MSAGHHHRHHGDHKGLSKELEGLLEDAEVKAYLDRPYKLVRIMVPLTGGSSMDGRTYYIDPDVPKEDVESVLWHERVEKALRAVKGMGYARAHALATAAERERSGKGWEAYKARIGSVVRKNEKRGAVGLPKGFDLGPYRESGLMRLSSGSASSPRLAG